MFEWLHCMCNLERSVDGLGFGEELHGVVY
jgi:hypothetical protein